MSKITEALDKVATGLENKGFIKEAYAIDKIADVLDEASLPSNLVYYGLFFLPGESKKLLERAGQPLARIIPDPHVTFAFKPPKDKYPPSELLGKEYPVNIVGMGNDGRNQGYLVEIPEELKAYYLSPAPKHITLSVSQDGKPVDTKNLDFKPIAPFQVMGVLGYNTGAKTLYSY